MTSETLIFLMRPPPAPPNILRVDKGRYRKRQSFGWLTRKSVAVSLILFLVYIIVRRYAQLDQLCSSYRPQHGKTINLHSRQKLEHSSNMTKTQNVSKVVGQASVSKETSLSHRKEGLMTKDLYDAGYDIPNANLCHNQGAPLQLVVLVMSAPHNVEARAAIRLTWGRHAARRKDVAMSFIVSRAVVPELTSKIDAESALHGDVIRTSSFDDYSTLKALSVLEWVDTYCKEARFVLKTEDHTSVNIPKLMTFIESLDDQRTIFGQLAHEWRPIRSPFSYDYVSTTDYPASVFPNFTKGPTYLLTRDMVHDLYANALNTRYFWLEDVFITGIVAGIVGAVIADVSGFVSDGTDFNDACIIEGAISLHFVEHHEQFGVWRKILDGHDNISC